VHAWDTASGRELVTYGEHDNIVIATAISPDGRWAATGGGNNKEIHVWDLKTGQRRVGPDGTPLTLGGTAAVVAEALPIFRATRSPTFKANRDPLPAT
jgi:WD40 repeat protein